MATETVIDLRRTGDRDAAVARAARAVDEKRLVALPTETVYGVAACASDAGAVRRLREAAGVGEDSPLGLHVAGADALLEIVRDAAASPVQVRLVRTLTPGPVSLLVEMAPERLAGLRRRLGVPEHAIDNGREALLRAPSHPLAVAVIGRCASPVVMAGAVVPGARDVQEAIDALPGGDAVELALDDDPPPSGKPSTLVRLSADGGWRVEREGVFEERYIRKKMVRRILFVCTGNTCRSPMAAAIARAELQRRNDGVETVVQSAGVMASPGAPATPEAVEAVRKMGVEMPPHRSAPLTREAVADADVVFCMTPSHLDAVRVLDPSAADKAVLLDPAGGAVPDPIGGTQAAYDDAAARLRELIALRLENLVP